MNHSALASGAEGERMQAAGKALWTAMAEVVDQNPFYANASEAERAACIGRLCAQSFCAAVVDAVGPSKATFVVVSSLGRLIGQIAAQAPSEAASEKLFTALAEEVDIGAADYAELTTPRGRA